MPSVGRVQRLGAVIASFLANVLPAQFAHKKSGAWCFAELSAANYQGPEQHFLLYASFARLGNSESDKSEQEIITAPLGCRRGIPFTDAVLAENDPRGSNT